MLHGGMMDIQVRRVEYQAIEPMRELYRQEANCQIVHDSTLRRGLADPYLIHVNERVAGYAGISNKYDPGRLMEYYIAPHLRAEALPIYRKVLTDTQATSVEAQTNMPLMLLMLYDCGINIKCDAILFEDAVTTTLTCPNGVFRPIPAEEKPSIFEHHNEPQGDYGVEVNGEIVASGGYFTHYNPPYGDVYMEVSQDARRQGYGSYLVQEVKRMAYEAGKKPSARTGPDNIASRRTLQKAGFLPCAYMLTGEVNL
jgi:GNAT superfamily N-acetyltransferase